MGITVSFATVALRLSTDKKKERNVTTIRQKILVAAVALAIISLVFFYQTWTLFSQYQIVTSFNQHIRILSPYIDQRQRDLLVSEYSLIRTKAEYDSLYVKLRGISKANKVNLPDNPSYGFWSFRSNRSFERDREKSRLFWTFSLGRILRLKNRLPVNISRPLNSALCIKNGTGYLICSSLK